MLFRMIRNVFCVRNVCSNISGARLFRNSAALTNDSGHTHTGAQSTKGELKIVEKLTSAFPDAMSIQVVDVSGGCGSMYEVYVASKQFEGIKTLNQHKMVNEALKEEIKGMHGVRISTSSSHDGQK